MSHSIWPTRNHLLPCAAAPRISSLVLRLVLLDFLVPLFRLGFRRINTSAKASAFGSWSLSPTDPTTAGSCNHTCPDSSIFSQYYGCISWRISASLVGTSPSSHTTTDLFTSLVLAWRRICCTFLGDYLLFHWPSILWTRFPCECIPPRRPCLGWYHPASIPAITAYLWEVSTPVHSRGYSLVLEEVLHLKWSQRYHLRPCGKVVTV